MKLTTNFRSADTVISWVNQVFSSMITAIPDQQPDYEPLASHRGDPDTGAPVTVLGRGDPSQGRLRGPGALPGGRRRGRRDPDGRRRGLDRRRPGPRERVPADRTPRHRDPDPGQDLPPGVGGGSGERGHPVPHRVELAGLPVLRGPRSAEHRTGGRRPDRRAVAGRGAALTAVRAAATTTSGPGAPAAATSGCSPRPPRGSPSTRWPRR